MPDVRWVQKFRRRKPGSPCKPFVLEAAHCRRGPRRRPLHAWHRWPFHIAAAPRAHGKLDLHSLAGASGRRPPQTPTAALGGPLAGAAPRWRLERLAAALERQRKREAHSHAAAARHEN